MADPGAVKVIADAIGPTTADTRNAISAALDSGFNGPTILALYNQGNRDLSGGGVIWTAVRSKTSSENQQKQQAADEAARVKVGLSAAPPSRLDTKAADGNAKPPENSEFEDQVAQLVLAGFPEAQARQIARQAILKDLGLNSSGGIGGGGVAQAPVARFSFQTIGRTLYRANDLTGSLEPALGPNGAPITVPSELTGIQTDKNGDLVGYDPETKKTVVIQKGFSFPQSDPNVKTVVDAKTGTSYAVNVQTGARREIGTYDFPQISPQELENTRKAEVQQSESRLNRSLDITQENNNRTNSRLETDTIREILSNPTDFLARAFLSRGQASPQTPITQADLLNNLRSAIQQGAGGQSRVAAQPIVAPRQPVTPAPAPPSRLQSSIGTSDGSSIGPVGQNNSPSRIDPYAQAIQWAMESGNQGAVDSLRAAQAQQPSVPESRIATPPTNANPTQEDILAQLRVSLPGLSEQQYQERANADLAQTLRARGVAAYDPLSGTWYDRTNPPARVLELRRTYGDDPSLSQYPGYEPLGFANPAQQSSRLGDVTQAGILDLARTNSPPAVSALLGGGTGTENLTMSSPVQIGSPLQTSRLTGDETKSLGTRLAAEGTSIGDYSAQQNQLFGQKRTSPRARLVI